MPALFPKLVITLDVPRKFEDLVDRKHNAFAKESLREVIETHWKERIPLHFRQDARSRYGYKERKDAYKRMKDRRYQSRRDLVLTGASERNMKVNRKITVGGTAAKGTLKGTLHLRFAWAAKIREHFEQTTKHRRKHGNVTSITTTAERKKVRPNVTPADMKREMQAMTVEERRAIADEMKTRYLDKVQAYRSGRKRRRVAAQGG